MSYIHLIYRICDITMQICTIAVATDCSSPLDTFCIYVQMLFVT